MGNYVIRPFDLKVAGDVDITLCRPSRVGDKCENKYALADGHGTGFGKCWNGRAWGIPFGFPVLVGGYEQPGTHAARSFSGRRVRLRMPLGILPDK